MKKQLNILQISDTQFLFWVDKVSGIIKFSFILSFFNL